MMRKRPGAPGAGRLGWVAVLGLFSQAWLLAGCGEQDLYSPPTSPFQIVGRLSLPSGNYGVSVVGDYAYVAGGQAGLHVVDISDPAHPVLVSTHDTKKRADAVKVIALPRPDGTYLEIALVVEGTEGITTYNASRPDSVVDFGEGSTAVDGKGLHVIVPDDPNEPYTVYLAESWKGLRVFRSFVDSPGKLEYFGVFNYTRGYAMAVDVADGFAYVADDEMGLTVMDVRVLAPGRVGVVSYCDTPGEAFGIDVAEGYAYVADGDAGLRVFQVNGEETPVLVGSLSLAGRCQAIRVRDGKAFIAAGDGGLHVVDVRNPAAPVLMGTVITPDAIDLALGENGLVLVADEEGDLIIFRGPEPFEDVTAPAAVYNLSGTARTSTSIQLVWTAPGDDAFVGRASQYDVRYHSSPITAENWDSAIACVGEPLPSAAGEPDTFIVTGLEVETRYYLALKSADEVPLWSELSNVAEVETFPPLALTGGSVSPAAATAESTITYRVTYVNANGLAPTTAEIVLDGSAHDMAEVSGDYATGAVFEYQTSLSLGSHQYSFTFADALGNSAQTDPAAGPLVGVIIFRMGSPASENGRGSDETLHTVVLTRHFEAAEHEVTQAEYLALVGSDPSRFEGDNRPVEKVTWYDAIHYCNALSDQQGLTRCYAVDGTDVQWNTGADGYRLPTEAEWEYLCRAGTESAFFTGDLTEETCGLDVSLSLAGWYCGNADSSTHEVAQLQANDLGLYDTHGNVWEWCWDYYGPYEGSVVLDPAGPQTGSQRVIRGGSWYYFARECRSANREAYWPNSADDIVGFRVVRFVD